MPVESLLKHFGLGSIESSDRTASSVYADRSARIRTNEPLYRAVRELVTRHSSTRQVLDLGCSDLVATMPLLEEGYSIYGLDQDSGSLSLAKQNEGVHLVQADLSDFRFGPSSSIDTTVILDVLEHLEKAEAVEILANLRQVNPQMRVIVSMPNISILSLWTAKEFVMMVKNGERPATGLFDATHKILTDMNGHRNIFDRGGFAVSEAYYTYEDGVSGQWETLSQRNGHRLSKYSIAAGIVSSLFSLGDPSRYQQLNTLSRAYQGIYVLKPKDVTY